MSECAMTSQQCTPAFAALIDLVERLTSRKYVSHQYFYEWRSPCGKICVPLNDAEGLLHEFCHWLVADPAVRDSDNYGLEDESYLPAEKCKRQAREEKTCGWIEDALYEAAGVQRMYSSVDVAGYLRSPSLKERALSLLTSLHEADLQSLIEALSLPGGQACAYSDPQDVWPFTL